MKTVQNPLFGLYIHWPYCLSKCPYCDFFSHPCHSPDEEVLLNTYIRDLQHMKHLTFNHTLTSIFFGGGTPSLMSESFFEKIMNHIRQHFNFDTNIEITLEANPDAITPDKMRFFKSHGINRLSIGVQALNDSDLKFLGRKHSVQTAIKRITEAQNIFPRLNIDLIYARPNQTLKAWENELKTALNLGLTHYSLYQLTIEENTPFGKNNVLGADEENAERLYRLTDEIMTTANIASYEVSNYAQPGYESKHNLTYWTGHDYIGIGPAAHGRIGLTATEAPRNVNQWIKNGIHSISLTQTERFEEKILMGLRLTKTPFPTAGLSQKSIQKALKMGWITKNNNTITPTLEGTLMLNTLILTLLE